MGVPSVNAVTAGSTSPVAVHLACRSLPNGECENGLVPPLVDLAEANPKTQFDRTPFEVNTSWQSTPRGSQHLVAVSTPWRVLPPPARTESALEVAAANLGVTCMQSVGPG
ncbi:beta-ketoacyl synthase N-terminal-like domain-containing protein [Streptomyces sp. NPDC004752]